MWRIGLQSYSSQGFLRGSEKECCWRTASRIISFAALIASISNMKFSYIKLTAFLVGMFGHVKTFQTMKPNIATTRIANIVYHLSIRFAAAAAYALMICE